MGEVTVHQSTRLTAAKCRRAGFLSSVSGDGLVIFVAFIAVIAIVNLTIWLRYTARPSPKAKEKEAPAAAAISSTVPESDESENAPPPYTPPASSPPATEPEPDKAVVNFPNPKDTAPAFVHGTFIFAALVFSLVTLFFCFQYLNYCPEVEPNAPLGTGSIIWWCFYGVLVLGASSGFVSWGLLCWYVGGGKKQVISLDSIPLGLAIAMLLPFVLFYQGAVQLVRGCQKWFCGVAFEEEQDTVVEEVEADVEMQRLMKGNNDGNDDDEEVGGRS
ncbi:hypothetical protein V500_07089 [Pseudogymnoascus sp. VKM F-4518 (FW-2643)]|nr:hypothetical protein V500_07089 [Pseudogymnoascus sp. VKM F-4518 (FW-2643)]